MTGNFGISGYLVLAVYMLATISLGLSFAGKQKNLAEYFLAERSAPWWAVGISVLACDLSAISYMGSPSYTYYNDLRFPMGTFLAPLVVWLVAFLFIPFLARLQVYTIYEYLEHRFSLSSRLFASVLFLMQRALHIAIAIYAISWRCRVKVRAQGKLPHDRPGHELRASPLLVLLFARTGQTHQVLPRLRRQPERRSDRLPDTGENARRGRHEGVPTEVGEVCDGAEVPVMARATECNRIHRSNFACFRMHIS